MKDGTQARSGLVAGRDRRRLARARRPPPRRRARPEWHLPRRLGRRPRWAVLGRALRPDRRDQLGASGIYSNLLVRTLVGYNHVAGPAGQKLVPDLAVRVPTSTNGGRTYTFRLKRGIEFGLRSGARSPRRTSVTRSSDSPGRGNLPVCIRLRRYPGVRRLPRREGEVDLRHPDAEREDDRLYPDPAGR